ncbi:hypothetical protein SAMN06296056_101422 [Priestia filamentosa]|nr:hypothetical protein SAMN06296056_101422 [Priestia filamentosa]
MLRLFYIYVNICLYLLKQGEVLQELHFDNTIDNYIEATLALIIFKVWKNNIE